MALRRSKDYEGALEEVDNMDGMIGWWAFEKRIRHIQPPLAWINIFSVEFESLVPAWLERLWHLSVMDGWVGGDDGRACPSDNKH